MSGTLSLEIQHDFINELKSYIPPLKALIGKLAAGSGGAKELTELHRLVHTIRGASSLVKLNDLNRVAAELERVIEAIIERRLNMNGQVVDAVRAVLDYFDQYPPGGQGRQSPDTDEVAGVLVFLQSLGQTGTVEKSSEAACPLTGDGPCSEDEDPWQEPLDGGEEDILVELPQEELREGFQQEAEEHFQALGEALGALENQITAPTVLTPAHKELLRSIRRAVHTVKGAAAVIKLKEIAEWGHDFEDLLDYLYEEAGRIDPETIRLVAEAADLLEHHVSAPERIDPDKANELRRAFKRVSARGDDTTHDSVPPAREDDHPGSIHLFETQPVSEPVLAPGPAEDAVAADPETFPPAAGSGKTLRVDMAKIESLVNLSGELIVALSAFEENMTGLGDVIGELDRSRHRLKTAARDLEVGYEVKAIQHLGSHLGKVPAVGLPDESPAGAFNDFDLLELDRYSEFNLLIRSLNETAVDVSAVSSQLSDMHGGFSTYLHRLRQLLSELQEKVMRVRMTPMSTIGFRLRQTVRETAGVLGKQVRFQMTGDEIELDKQVWEKLADPLMHLLRNAVDHGTESPQTRRSAGKPESALIRLSAVYQGNQVVIRVADDGAGLDYDAIRRRAQTLQTNKPPADMSPAELAELMFLQGFSTRQKVSTISGRGVGLDVVRENIASLQGNVQVEQSETGRGTTFIIRIPLTLAVIRALLFDVGGRLYATALYDIKEMLRIDPKDVHQDGQSRTVQIGDRRLPLYLLSEILSSASPKALTAEAMSSLLVLVVESGDWQGAVVIDRMHSQREIVIKHLGSHLRQVRGITGATIMGDGKVVPILDLEALLGKSQYRRPSAAPRQTPEQRALDILVVDDSISVRTVVSRLIQRQGWRAKGANDGVDALEKLRTYRPDLILLDVEMPRMNGYEFMSTLRSQEMFEEIPVIMLTSRSAQKHRDKARSVGVNGYVVKPYEDEALIGAIRRLTATDGGQIP